MVPFAAKLVLVGCELPITHQRTAGTFPVVESVAADLKQIGVDYVDLMLLHWSCDTMEQTVAHYKLMQDLVKPSLAADGSYAAPLAKAIGISNFNASAIESLLAAPGVTVKPAANQVRGRSSDRDVWTAASISLPVPLQCGYSIANHDNLRPGLGRDDATREYCLKNDIAYEGANNSSQLNSTQLNSTQLPCEV